MQKDFSNRATAPALDAVLGAEHPVLDHGFVRVVDYMGNDAAVVQAARVSYGAGTKTSRDDAGLIRYLMRHRHTSPFEMCVLKLHIKAPVFVARQWLRHRTAAVNEISARYSILKDEFYSPDPAFMAAQSSNNKQGRSRDPLPLEQAERAKEAIDQNARRAYAAYEGLLTSEEGGLARELARLTLPVNVYTEWYWRIDLHNLLHFLQLRLDAHAQYEIRAYAEVIAGIAHKWVPFAWAAFEAYRLGGASLSSGQLAWLRAKLGGRDVQAETKGMTAGERRELLALLGLSET